MDLKQRFDILDTGDIAHDYPPGQFAGMSNRAGKKPIIVACNGHAHGMWFLFSFFLFLLVAFLTIAHHLSHDMCL